MPIQWTLMLPPLAGGEAQRIELSGTMKVGRAGRCNVVIQDRSTSSSHATLEVRGDELFVRDHGSTNGTTINGGDRLPMGEWTVVPSSAMLRFGVVHTRVIAKVAVEPGAPLPSAPVQAAATAAELLEQMEARLILLDGHNPRSIRVTEMTHDIGRSMSMSCRIESKRVSSEHAVLSFSPNTHSFQIQDLGSSNHTKLNGGTLSPSVAHLLEMDSALEFGPIEAVFRVDHSVDGVRLPGNFDLKVTDALIASGKLTEDDLHSAAAFAEETAGFLGDGLLLSGLVSPTDWAEAARTARESGPAVSYRAAKSSGWQRSLVVAGLVMGASLAIGFYVL